MKKVSSAFVLVALLVGFTVGQQIQQHRCSRLVDDVVATIMSQDYIQSHPDMALSNDEFNTQADKCSGL